MQQDARVQVHYLDVAYTIAFVGIPLLLLVLVGQAVGGGLERQPMSSAMSRKLGRLAPPIALFVSTACYGYTIPRDWRHVELERVRVLFEPARPLVLQAWGGDSLPVLVREVEGRVAGVQGDTLELVLINAIETNGNYLRAVTTDQRVRVVADANARVAVRHISAVRNILFFGTLTAAPAVYVWLLSST